MTEKWISILKIDPCYKSNFNFEFFPLTIFILIFADLTRLGKKRKFCENISDLWKPNENKCEI